MSHFKSATARTLARAHPQESRRWLRAPATLAYCGVVTQHYFSSASEAGPDEMRLVEVPFRGSHLQMWVSRQVFSSTRLDPGTKQLLQALPHLPPSGTFLDLGCGWGAIAVAVAKASPAATVWAVDVNPRAVSLTARNAQINDAPNVRAMAAEEALELVEAKGVSFDVIVSNPPIRIGKAALHALLDTWLAKLAPTGSAWLVVSKNLGADSLIRWLGGRGYRARKHSSRKSFRIIQVQPASPTGI